MTNEKKANKPKSSNKMTRKQLVNRLAAGTNLTFHLPEKKEPARPNAPKRFVSGSRIDVLKSISAPAKAAIRQLADPALAPLCAYPDGSTSERGRFRQKIVVPYAVQAGGGGAFFARADAHTSYATFTTIAGAGATDVANPLQAQVISAYKSVRCVAICVEIQNTAAPTAQQGSLVVVPVRKYSDDFAAYPATFAAATQLPGAIVVQSTGAACFRGTPLSHETLAQWQGSGAARAVGYLWGLWIGFEACGNATAFNIVITTVMEGLPASQVIMKTPSPSAGDCEKVVQTVSDQSKYPMVVWKSSNSLSYRPMMNNMGPYAAAA